MATAEPAEAATYDLPLPDLAAEASLAEQDLASKPLPEPLLVRNAQWFCRLRWVVIALLLLFGGVAAIPAVRQWAGLRPPGIWPFAASAVLVIGNLAALAWARWSDTARGGALRNLWGQIVMDLIVLTIVVHFLGSVRTYIPFAYLFHIVLACIFFTRRQSFMVLLIAVGLLAACVGLEHTGVVPEEALFIKPVAEAPATSLPLALAACVAIWLAVWYLTSQLSVMVRERDARLAETNRRLLAAQEERARHMLVTTHQLKSPFAAIHANAHILLAGYLGPLPPEAVEVVRRIKARCNRLASEIQEMLQLANLSSSSQDQPKLTRLDLGELLNWAADQMAPVAQVRRIRIECRLEPTLVVGSADHFKMLLGNLVSNAVNYSFDGGTVRLSARAGADGGAVVTIADEGIGIAPEKLPHIFEEHYRTKEAVQHHSESSGLGLAIVRHVAQLHRIRVSVSSCPGKGTTFTLVLPGGEGNNAAKPSAERGD